ncbi:N-acetylglucosamine 6-phosphate deacetylase [Sanguibacter gelidistatuariae]|uniref:N-acetylglucosamine-6-phosphate deacetylase n=1 Tax=Sanguibacter gelidistatuariae TaxID=1814289 RepID=A0A1G6H341_9MICO|nr:N-acetylglucosamine-6-phosphate deacetylase [Sanguibacter gelidistatuariae]SDB87836.1 N-acetylglucosamine 6-phosphate deacetylase [Sanguibacter gelidistatuariae]
MTNTETYVITGGTVHTGQRVVRGGWLAVADGLVAGVGEGEVPPDWSDLPRVDATGHQVVPGFVDIHSHGGGGAAFGAGSSITDSARTVIATHRSHGTTTMIASLVTQPMQVLREAVEVLADLVEAGDLAGIHLEGPWLSPLHRGAHDPNLLREPTIEDIDFLLGARPGAVKVVTIAPELPGGLDAVRRIVGHGAIAAIGHTDADAAMATASVDAGVTLATHLFNAMLPIHHRAPGPVLALLEDPRVVVEVVADGVHLHPITLEHAARSAGVGRTVFVTDAMAAAGVSDGEYLLGDLVVDVVDGVARLREGGSIAGSTLTLDVALRYATTVAGIPFEDALAAVTTTPAAVLGRTDVGNLEPGARADVVVLDETVTVRDVFRSGERLV